MRKRRKGEVRVMVRLRVELKCTVLQVNGREVTGEIGEERVNVDGIKQAFGEVQVLLRGRREEMWDDRNEQEKGERNVQRVKQA